MGLLFFPPSLLLCCFRPSSKSVKVNGKVLIGFYGFWIRQQSLSAVVGIEEPGTEWHPYYIHAPASSSF